MYVSDDSCGGPLSSSVNSVIAGKSVCMMSQLHILVQ